MAVRWSAGSSPANTGPISNRPRRESRAGRCARPPRSGRAGSRAACSRARRRSGCPAPAPRRRRRTARAGPGDERPGQRLLIAGGGQRPPGGADAGLAGRQHAAGRPRRSAAAARPAGRRSRRSAPLPRPGRPGPRRRGARSAAGRARPRASKPKVARIVRSVRSAGRRGRRAARHRPGSKAIAGGRRRRLAGEHDLRGLAAAHLQDQPRRQLQPGDHEARIDAAGEAVLGVGDDAGLAAGLGGADRVEPGALDEHLGGLLGAAGGLAAHHPAQADRARAVGDDAHLGGRPHRSCRPAPRRSRPAGPAAPR